jgi:plastocyanin
MRLRGLLILTAAAAVMFVPAAVPATLPQLIGTVGPGFSININHPDGTLVTQIDPGTYEIVVSDLAEEHNFHLSGPGVDQATAVETTGNVTWTVTFVDGRYKVVCDPHSLQLHREFVVGTPPPPPPKPPVVPKLLATVGPKSTISLKSASGAALKKVKAGTYSITVRDRSKLHNFHLVGKGVNRKSGLAGTGTLTWKVKLSAGVLRYFSDKSPKTVKGSVTVTPAA